jgi:hypothetical protein
VDGFRCAQSACEGDSLLLEALFHEVKGGFCGNFVDDPFTSWFGFFGGRVGVKLYMYRIRSDSLYVGEDWFIDGGGDYEQAIFLGLDLDGPGEMACEMVTDEEWAFDRFTLEEERYTMRRSS